MIETIVEILTSNVGRAKPANGSESEEFPAKNVFKDYLCQRSAVSNVTIYYRGDTKARCAAI